MKFNNLLNTHGLMIRGDLANVFTLYLLFFLCFVIKTRMKRVELIFL